MPLESTVLCLDDSEYMRNGDFAPTRLEAQRDAVNLIAGTKLNGHPESTVGVMTMAGRREFLVTLTSDIGKILTAVHTVTPAGDLDLLNSIQVAWLALKHRQMRNGGQRIIVFVGSPISSDQKDLVKLGKKLKKNKISVDVVSFGEEEANTDQLEAFIQAVNTDEDSSHLITVPSGVRVLTDALMSSPLLSGGGGGGGGGGGMPSDDFSQYGGVDPNMDPELALALRVSMEEAKTRQEAELEQNKDTDATPAADKPSEDDDMEEELKLAMQMSQGGNPDATTDAATNDDDDDMDEELRLAMQMSMASSDPKTDDGAAAMDVDEGTQEKEFSELSEEEQIARALQMSMADSMDTDEKNDDGKEKAGDDKDEKKDVSELLQSETFLTSILETLPNVDPNDADIRGAVQQLASGMKKDEEKKDETKDGKK